MSEIGSPTSARCSAGNDRQERLSVGEKGNVIIMMEAAGLRALKESL